MPVNGVRVLPDIPKNMSNMEVLRNPKSIKNRKFETGSSLSTSCRDTSLKSSILEINGNCVKKIIEAYESMVKSFNENRQREQIKKISNFSNTLDVIKNSNNVEKNNSVIYDVPNSQCQNFTTKKKYKIFSTSFEAREVEDDFIIRPKSIKTVSKTWPRSSKINMYSSMDELSINVQSSPSERNEIWNETWSLRKRHKNLEDRTKKDKVMICSSPLEDVEDKDLDYEDSLDDILTSSCGSSSNNSYRNLQADLYKFEDEQRQFELSSTSSSLESSLGSSHDSINVNNDGSLLQNLSRATNASLNENRSIKIDNNTRVTSAVSEKLSRKKPLKELLKSAFNTKLLKYKKTWKKSTKKQSNERTSDPGFTERLLSSSSFFSLKSWHSDPNDKPLMPTFETFGRTKNVCINDKTRSKSSRMVLTEVPREEFIPSDSKSSDLTSWIPLSVTTTSCKKNHGNVEPSLKSTMFTNSSKLKVPCGYPPLPKHPYLIRNGIPKHPFVAKTMLDQTTEKEMVEGKEMECDVKECEYDTHEFVPSNILPQTELNTSYSKMAECLTLSSSNCNLLRSCSCKALDELVPQQIPVNNNHICNVNTDLLSTVHNNLDMPKKPCTHRYATVSPKNLRFSMSQQKLQVIEKSFDI